MNWSTFDDEWGQAQHEHRHTHPQPAYARRLHVPLPEPSRSIRLVNAQERTDQIGKGLINIGITWAISAFVYLCIASSIHTMNIWVGFKVLCVISFGAALAWTIALCLSKVESDRLYLGELNAYRESAYLAKQKEEYLNARERRRRSTANNNTAGTKEAQGQKAIPSMPPGTIPGWSDLDDMFASQDKSA